MVTDKRIPRGVRNQNPLNIKLGQKWLGLVSNPREQVFCTFASMAYGWRAAFILLIGTYRSRGWNTVRKIISYWAPEADHNRTADYMAYVCQMIGLSVERELEIEDYLPVALAMARVENGLVVTQGVVLGFKMAIDALCEKKRITTEEHDSVLKL